MTVGFHSPLPPQRTGVADYSAALLTALRRRGRVEVRGARAGVQLYHVGNNRLHAAIYRRAIENPGVVVLHDAVLNHLLLGLLDEREYAEEFAYNYGEWSRGAGEDLWRTRARSAASAEYFRYPMLRRIAERSRAVIVHNAAAADIVRAHAPAARAVVIPHLFEKPPKGRARVLGPGFTFGVFGYLRETKRVTEVIRAFQRVHAEWPSARLVIAGECVSPEYARVVDHYTAGPGVFRMPYLGDSDFWAVARGTGCCINLRHPAAGETSGIAVRMMGIGRAVVLTDGKENGGYPETACVRVPHDSAERDLLAAYMGWFCAEPEAARALGARAAAHIDEHHGIDRVADEYWRVLEDARG